MDKDKWLEENADRLSRLERLDRVSMSSQNQLNVQQQQVRRARKHIFEENVIFFILRLEFLLKLLGK